MAHVPHLYLPGPWAGPEIALDDARRHHLTGVLRRSEGAEVSYTDGAGRIGTGLLGMEAVVRGAEGEVPEPVPRLTVAAAAPRSRDRARFLVEKLAEIGVDELVWLNTRFGQAAPPPAAKARMWAEGALEQSRGAFLMDVSGPVDPATLDGLLLFGEHGAGRDVPDGYDHYTLVIGPEGGFHEDEVPVDAHRIGFSARILRIETAALVGAAILQEGLDR